MRNIYLENKTAIVTGVASGMAKGIFLKFSEEGCAVVVAGIDDAGGVYGTGGVKRAIIVLNKKITIQYYLIGIFSFIFLATFQRAVYFLPASG